MKFIYFFGFEIINFKNIIFIEFNMYIYKNDICFIKLNYFKKLWILKI